MTDLAVALYYVHDAAGIWSLEDLANHRGVIAPENLGASGFSESRGMLRVNSDRIYGFLSHSSCIELIEYVVFLWGTLAATAAKPVPRTLRIAIPPTKDGTFNSVVGLCIGEDMGRIVVQDAGDLVSLSYVNREGLAPDYRLSPYFVGLSVPKVMWRSACCQALDEFFKVAQEQVEKDSDSLIGKWVQLWADTRCLIMSPG
jgi:hypothetical protein